MGKLYFKAVYLLVKSTAAVPSDISLELPAVLNPFGLKEGLNFDKPCKVVPFLGPSSLVTFVIIPFSSYTVIGTISLSNHPFS